MAVQEVSKTEAGIAGLHECSLVAHTALAVVKGRQYAVVPLCTALCTSTMLLTSISTVRFFACQHEVVLHLSASLSVSFP